MQKNRENWSLFQLIQIWNPSQDPWDHVPDLLSVPVHCRSSSQETGREGRTTSPPASSGLDEAGARRARARKARARRASFISSGWTFQMWNKAIVLFLKLLQLRFETKVSKTNGSPKSLKSMSEKKGMQNSSSTQNWFYLRKNRLQFSNTSLCVSTHSVGSFFESIFFSFSPRRLKIKTLVLRSRSCKALGQNFGLS